jgi:catechol 2,3-dioxygenase-like lactoylglutathione lyase family enzyme
MITAMPRLAIATADFDGIVRVFRHGLGLPVIDLSERTVPQLGARIAMCVPEGGSNIELMSPAVPEAPLSQSLLRFLERRGPGLFALMLEAPDPDQAAVALAQRGLAVLPLMAGAGGRDIHPGSTHGVLIRVYPDRSFTGQAPAGWTGRGISGVQRAVIAVKDIDAAIDTYGRQLGLAAQPPVRDAQRGIASALVRPPAGGMIELVSVIDPTQPGGAALARHLATHPTGLHALVLHAPDPMSLLPDLQAAGLPATPCADMAGTIEIAPSATFGARVRIAPGAVAVAVPDRGATQ